MSTWTDVSGASSTWTPLGSIVLEIMAYEVLNYQDSITPSAKIGNISISEKISVRDTKADRNIKTFDNFMISENKTVTK